MINNTDAKNIQVKLSKKELDIIIDLLRHHIKEIEDTPLPNNIEHKKIEMEYRIILYTISDKLKTLLKNCITKTSVKCIKQGGKNEMERR